MIQEKWLEAEIKRRAMSCAAGLLVERGLLDSAEKSRLERMIFASGSAGGRKRRSGREEKNGGEKKEAVGVRAENGREGESSVNGRTENGREEKMEGAQ
ncbi:MAG: hypothetical protein NC400_04965 [Clostridium sp.]|nr:hypothetical protein [Clostridium sp.]